MQRVAVACDAIRDIACRVAVWMGGQPSVGEESLTDWALFEVSQRLPWVRYRKFTRHEESRESGADWDWWLVSRGGALGLRVQAKKVVAGADHYRGLAHTSRTGLQMELLLEASREDNLLPFYALYHCAIAQVGLKCGGGTAFGVGEGIALADAGSLYTRFLKPGRGRVDAEGLLSESNPLSCLFCCPLVSERGSDPVHSAYRFITHYYGEGLREFANRDLNTPGLLEKPPAHIQALLEHESVPEWWEREFAPSLRQTNAVFVCDLQGE